MESVNPTEPGQKISTNPRALSEDSDPAIDQKASDRTSSPGEPRPKDCVWMKPASTTQVPTPGLEPELDTGSVSVADSAGGGEVIFETETSEETPLHPCDQEVNPAPDTAIKTGKQQPGHHRKHFKKLRNITGAPRRFGSRFTHRIALTTRLTILLGVLLTFGLAISGATVVGILQSHLVGQVDDQLNKTVKRISTTQEWQSLVQNNQPQPSNYYLRVRSGTQVQESIWEATVDEAGHPSEQDLQKLEQLAISGNSTTTTISSQDSSTPWRAISIPVITQDNTVVGVITLALPLKSVMNTLRNTRIYVSTISAALVIFCILAAYFLIKLFLSPLREIEKVAGKIASGELHERIVTKESERTEVGSLTKSLNTMLSQIEQAFARLSESDERIRRFVSDASHELRTPLAAIRGYGELYRIGGIPAQRTEEVFGRIESEATRMGKLVEDLLKLARLDEGRRVQKEPVNVYQLASNAALDLSALNPDRPVQLLKYGSEEPVDIAGGDQIEIIADPSLLTQVLTNLVGNVDRYAPGKVPTEIVVGLLDRLPEGVSLHQVHPPANGGQAKSETKDPISSPTPDSEAAIKADTDQSSKEFASPTSQVTGTTPNKAPSARQETATVFHRSATLNQPTALSDNAPESPHSSSRPKTKSAASGTKTDKYVLIQVVDHGPGIAEQELEKVFERFYRSDTSRSRETGGTGLGLSIVAAVAATHGGVARAVQTPGGGLTVEIYLPYCPPQENK